MNDAFVNGFIDEIEKLAVHSERAGGIYGRAAGRTVAKVRELGGRLRTAPSRFGRAFKASYQKETTTPKDTKVIPRQGTFSGAPGGTGISELKTTITPEQHKEMTQRYTKLVKGKRNVRPSLLKDMQRSE